MNRTRSLTLLLAGTAFLSIGNSAFALDGGALVAKINEVYLATSGATLSAAETEVDGSTVTLKGAKVDFQGNDVSVGDVVLDDVVEADGGYTIGKATFQDIDFKKNGDELKVSDVYVDNITLPAKLDYSSLDGMAMAESVHFGAGELNVAGKKIMTFEEASADYKIDDDKTKIDIDSSLTGLQFDATGAPDPKVKEAITALGLENISGEVKFKGSWSVADGKIDVSEYSFDFDNIGKLDINLGISGYTLAFMKNLQDTMKAVQANPDKAAAQQAAGMAMMGLMQQLSYGGAKIRFDDAGITAKILDYAGKQQGMDGKQFAQAAKAMVPLMIAQLNMPDLQAQITNAVNAYLDEPKSIEISAIPAAPVPVPQIMGGAMANPASLTQMLNVKVEANQ